jgi:hypothetical protein
MYIYFERIVQIFKQSTIRYTTIAKDLEKFLGVVVSRATVRVRNPDGKDTDVVRRENNDSISSDCLFSSFLDGGSTASYDIVRGI